MPALIYRRQFPAYPWRGNQKLTFSNLKPHLVSVFSNFFCVFLCVVWHVSCLSDSIFISFPPPPIIGNNYNPGRWGTALILNINSHFVAVIEALRIQPINWLSCKIKDHLWIFFTKLKRLDTSAIIIQNNKKKSNLIISHVKQFRARSEFRCQGDDGAAPPPFYKEATSDFDLSLFLSSSFFYYYYSCQIKFHKSVFAALHGESNCLRARLHFQFMFEIWLEIFPRPPLCCTNSLDWLLFSDFAEQRFSLYYVFF